jgi:hypothetical protein
MLKEPQGIFSESGGGGNPRVAIRGHGRTIARTERGLENYAGRMGLS